MKSLKELKQEQKRLENELKPLYRYLSTLNPESEAYLEYASLILLREGLLLLAAEAIAEIENALLNTSGFTPN